MLQKEIYIQSLICIILLKHLMYDLFLNIRDVIVTL